MKSKEKASRVKFPHRYAARFTDTQWAKVEALAKLEEFEENEGRVIRAGIEALFEIKFGNPKPGKR